MQQKQWEQLNEKCKKKLKMDRRKERAVCVEIKNGVPGYQLLPFTAPVLDQAKCVDGFQPLEEHGTSNNPHPL